MLFMFFAHSPVPTSGWTNFRGNQFPLIDKVLLPRLKIGFSPAWKLPGSVSTEIDTRFDGLWLIIAAHESAIVGLCQFPALITHQRVGFFV